MVAKDLVYTIVVLTHGTESTCLSNEWSGLFEIADNGERIRSLRYFGATSSLDLRTRNCIFN